MPPPFLSCPALLKREKRAAREERQGQALPLRTKTFVKTPLCTRISFLLLLRLKTPGIFTDNEGMKVSLSEAMKAAAGDQRAWRRYPVCLTVLVQRILEDGVARSERETARRCPNVSVIVTDISLSGLVFVSSRPYPPGSLVEIQVSLGANVYPIHAVVKRSQVMLLPGRRAFACAAQFVQGEAVARFIPTVAKYLHRRSTAK